MPSLLKAKGLGTYHNELGLKEGSLLTADNIVIDRNDVIKPRRGLANYGTVAPCCGSFNQIITYKDRILVHDGTKLLFDSDCKNGTFTEFSGCYAPLETGIRIKSVESNGNLFFTTTDGMKKISGTLDSCCNTNFVATANFITSSGGPKALDTTGVVTYECGAFLKALAKVAYRVVWGIKDANKNLILGSPSSRLVIANTDGTSLANVCVTFTIPSDVTSTCYFYQLYRTGCVCEPCCCILLVPCLEPGDEMNLVFEAAPTAAEITAGTITIKDCAADCRRESGVLLYTNPVSGDGILQANEKPPVAKDVELFRNSVFFSNTSTVQREQFTFLSVSCLESECSKFIVGNCSSAREYTFVGATEKSTITTKAQACITDGDYFLMNSASNEKKYFFWFDTCACACVPCTADTVGRIAAKVLITGGGCPDSACDVATKLEAVICALTDFTSTVATNVVTVCVTKNGNVVDVIDATPCANKTTFTFAVTTQGLGEQPNTGSSPAVIVVACCDVCVCCCSFTEVAHGFCTGVRGQWTTTASDLPSGLSVNVDYFIIRCSACVFSVATSRINALAGTAVAIADAGTGTHTFTSLGGDVLLSSLLSASQSVDESSRSLVNIINRDACGIVNAFYLSGEDDLPGIILLEARNLSDAAFFIAIEDDCTDITARFSPKLDRSFAIASMAAVPCSTTQTRVTAACHGLVVCDCVYIYNTPCNVTFGKYKILAKTCCTFDITQAFTCDSVGRAFDINQVSDNEVKPNRLFFSKSDRPEAVPLVNFIDVGGRDDAIERIVALRDNLFIMKEDGVYILTGEEGNFNVRLLDNSTFILAPDSASVLNNQIFMLSSQGVATVSDTGIGVVSRPIEDKILEVSNDRFNFRTIAFGTSYESDRSYILWLPTATTDTTATQAFRFNTFNRSWVRWTIDARAGMVNPVDDKLYISSGDSSFIRQERKNDDRTDFADGKTCLCIPVQTICPCTPHLDLATVCCLDVGDALVQTQFITIAKFNRMLRKLDLDSACLCSDYFSTQELTAGCCSAQALIDLRNKIALDIPIAALPIPFGCVNICSGCPANSFIDAATCTVENCLRAVITTCCAPVTSPTCLLNCGNVVYFKCVTATTFKLSATRGGSAITITGAGGGTHTITPTYATPAAAPSTFAIIRTDFNDLAACVNASPLVQFGDYATIGACCCVEFEALVTGKCVTASNVCLSFFVPYIVGPVEQFKGIKAKVDWAPQHFGDPSIMKQVAEGTIVFDGNNFFDASVAYSTDLSKDFEERRFNGQGTGFWGGFVFGCAAWGGEGTDVPYRTLIPRQKQRCRYMTVRFSHDNAREDFTILGISLDARQLSTRAYRGIK